MYCINALSWCWSPIRPPRHAHSTWNPSYDRRASGGKPQWFPRKCNRSLQNTFAVGHFNWVCLACLPFGSSWSFGKSSYIPTFLLLILTFRLVVDRTEVCPRWSTANLDPFLVSPTQVNASKAAINEALGRSDFIRSPRTAGCCL